METRERLKEKFADNVNASLSKILGEKHRFNGEFSEEFSRLTELDELADQRSWQAKEMKNKKSKALSALRSMVYKLPQDDFEKLARWTYWHLKGVFDFEGVWRDIFYSQGGNLSDSVKIGIYDGDHETS